MNASRFVARISKLLFLLMCAIWSFGPAQQSAKSNPEGRKLLSHVIEGLGGAARVQAVRALRTKHATKYEWNSRTVTYKCETVVVYPDKFWEKQTSPEGEVLHVVTSKQAFRTSAERIENMSPHEVTAILGHISLDPIFIAQHADDHEYGFFAAGTENVSGRRTRILDVTTPEMKVRWFVDDETGHVVRITLQEERKEDSGEYSDFRNVQGVTFAFKVGLAQYESIEVNPRIDPKIFLRPGQKERASVSTAAGKELLDKVVRSMGGEANVKSVRSMRIKGVLSMGNIGRGKDVLTEINILLPHNSRYQSKIPDGDLSVVRLKNSAFTQLDSETRDLPNDDETLIEQQPALAVIDPIREPVFAAQRAFEAGAVLTVAGSTKLGSTELQLLDISDSTMDIRWFVDPQTCRIVRAAWNIGRSNIEITKEYSEWKPIGGLWLPFHVNSQIPRRGKIDANFKQIEINVTMDPAIFGKPKFAQVERPELKTLFLAQSFRIKSAWGGLGPSMTSVHDLRRERTAFRGTARFRENEETEEEKCADDTISIPTDTVLSFLRTLRESQLEERRYVPFIDHTDDYPSISIEIPIRGDTVRFYSESQGRDRVPWAVEIAGRTYVVPMDAPARALALLSTYLERKIPLLPKVLPEARDFYKSGMKKRNQHDFQRAVADFTKAIELKPDYVEAYIIRATDRSMLKDYQGAITDYTRLMVLTSNLGYLYEIAQTKRLLKDYRGAIDDFTKYIESKPNVGKENGYLGRSAAKEELKDYEGAIADLSKYIDLSPQRRDWGMFERMADLRYRAKDYRGAIEAITKAVEYEPTLARGFFFRGRIKVEQKDYHGAINDYSKAIELMPRDWYYTERGRIKQVLHDDRGAQADFAKAAELRRAK